jgi:hypothetical protein
MQQTWLLNNLGWFEKALWQFVGKNHAIMCGSMHVLLGEQGVSEIHGGFLSGRGKFRISPSYRRHFPIRAHR